MDCFFLQNLNSSYFIFYFIYIYITFTFSCFEWVDWVCCFVCCDGESSQFLHSLCLKFNSPSKTLVCSQSLSFSHFCSQSHTGSHCFCKGVTVSSGVPYCGYMLKVCVYFSCFVYQQSCCCFSMHVLLWCNPFMQSGIFVIIIMYFFV